LDAVFRFQGEVTASFAPGGDAAFEGKRSGLSAAPHFLVAYLSEKLALLMAWHRRAGRDLLPARGFLVSAAAIPRAPRLA
jgi:hypothetical protein